MRQAIAVTALIIVAFVLLTGAVRSAIAQLRPETLIERATR
jgi:hypothetical protein